LECDKVTFLASLATSVSIQTRKQCCPSRIRFLMKRDGVNERTTSITTQTAQELMLICKPLKLGHRETEQSRGSYSMEHALVGAVVSGLSVFETKSRLFIKPSLV
jgi:hypothetical protein